LQQAGIKAAVPAASADDEGCAGLEGQHGSRRDGLLLQAIGQIDQELQTPLRAPEEGVATDLRGRGSLVGVRRQHATHKVQRVWVSLDF
jgi:hypothetical protein